MKIYDIFYCFCTILKLLTIIAPIKLSNEYDDFEALIRVLRDLAIEDHFVYFVKCYHRFTFVTICRTKHDNLERISKDSRSVASAKKELFLG